LDDLRCVKSAGKTRLFVDSEYVNFAPFDHFQKALKVWAIGLRAADCLVSQDEKIAMVDAKPCQALANLSFLVCTACFGLHIRGVSGVNYVRLVL
jgi:hypothetical protein